MKKTWLSRKINGITMQGEPGEPGEPAKDKKSGVKPYITYNPNDPRIQAYSDSLSVHNQYKNKIQPDYKITSTSWNSKVAKQEYQKLATKRDANDDYIYEPLEESNRVQDAVRAKYRGQWEKLKGSRGVIGSPYEKLSRQMSEEVTKAGKPFWDIVNQRQAEVGKDNNEMGARMRYLKSQHETTKDNQLKFEFNKPDSSFNVKGMTPVSWDKTVVEGNSYYTGKHNVVNNKYGKTFGARVEGTGSDVKNPDSVTYSPKFEKPTQRVILREKIEKMPIGKLKSKSTTPNKLGNRQTVMGTSGKREPASMYQKRKGLTDNQMYRTFPGLDPNKTK